MTGLALGAMTFATANAIERVSIAADGTEANDRSERPAMSPNGQYVVFVSYADNLIPGGSDGNDRQIFLKNRMTGAVVLASKTKEGVEAEDGCGNPTVSADGRYVCFNTGSGNLNPGDDNNDGDVYVKDLKTGALEWISQAPDGSAGDDGSANAFITPDGRYVVFQSRAENLDPDGDTNQGDKDIFVKDRKTGLLERVNETADGTQANDDSENPYITPDGRFVSFRSRANNLVPNDTSSMYDYDIFVKDRKTGKVERVSTSSDEEEADDSCYCHHMSDDGRYAVFRSRAGNLVPDDTNDTYDAFVKDRITGQTERVSVSADGSEANSYSGGVWISSDGRFAAFWSRASNLVDPGLMKEDNDYDQIYVKDRKNGRIARVSESAEGDPGNQNSRATFMTGGGYIAFKSYADNLVPNDTNGSVNYWEGEDIFLAKNPFSAYRPDGGVGKNRSSSRSSLSLKNPSGKAHKFYLTAENKGNVFDDLCIKGDSGGAKYRTSYRQIGGGNVTGDVLRGKLVSGQIPGEKAVLQCIAKPKGKSQRKATLTHRVKSSGARSKQDVARAKVENDAPKKEPVSVKPTSLF
jgi:Tol biopolymer transport system component